MGLLQTASAWNEEYRRGRYVDEPPVAFVDDILAAATREGITATWSPCRPAGPGHL